MSQKKKGFYLDDEDQETSMYFNGQTPQSQYRDREIFNSGSPLQAFTSSNQLYQQQNLGRTYNGNTAAFQRSTPTSMLPPQSPNRNVLGSIAQRGFHQMNQPFPTSLQQQQQQQQSLQKRLANVSNYGGFSQQPAFGFQSQPQPLSRTSSSTNDMQATSQMSIDLSAAEFPSLTNRNIPQPQSMAASRVNYVGMVGGNTKTIDGAGEFSMQQEDFPALPGSAPTQNGPESSKTVTISSPETSSASKDPPRALELKSSKSVQCLPDGSMTNIPQGMVADQFGILGVLAFLREPEPDPNLVALAPGVDLTSLGLNLNGNEPLYSTFQSPWADGPCRPQDIDYHVPSEYLINVFIREKLAPIKLHKYGEDLLFYMFYSNPGDILQLAASSELYNRDWRYHKEEQIWITRVPGMEPQVKCNTYEYGHYYVFNALNWRKELKEIHLEYSKLEDRPQPFSGSQQQQQAQQQQLVSTASNPSIASH